MVILKTTFLLSIHFIYFTSISTYFSIFQIDVWAAGVILYILLCGYPPFVSQDNDQEKLFDCILSGQYDFPDEYWQDVSALAKELIQNMLQLQPDVRFSAEDVLDHPWLQIANC